MAEIKVFEVAPKREQIPFTPYLHLCVSEYGSDSDGNIFLSSILMTDKEIDEAVDLLISQLENARKTAKTKLNKSKTIRK